MGSLDDSLIGLPECPICYLHFEDEGEDRRPCIGSCGHSICQGCVRRLKGECPKCRQKRAFNKITSNFQLMDQIRQQKKERIKIDEIVKVRDTKLKQLTDEMKQYADRVRSLEEMAKETPRYDGYICNKCGYPMMEGSAFICLTCMQSGLKTELHAVGFDEFSKLLDIIICGSCVLKHHKKHDSKEFCKLQLEKKMAGCREVIMQKIKWNSNRMEVLKGSTNMMADLDHMYLDMKSNILEAFESLPGSSSVKEFERKVNQLATTMKKVNDATNDVMVALYNLKQRFTDATDCSKQIMDSMPEHNEDDDVTVYIPESRYSDISFKDSTPTSAELPDPDVPGPSSWIPSGSEESRIITPTLDDSELLDNRASSPSWPAHSCTSPAVITCAPKLDTSPSSSPVHKRPKRVSKEDLSVPQRVFKFFDLDSETAQKLSTMIESLGGRVIPSGVFSPEDVTHVICSKLAHTVNVFCCIAKGCWFLKTEFITDCSDVKKWLPEDIYEWGNPNRTEISALMTDELLLISAAQRWRTSLSSSGWNTLGAFAGWRILLYACPERSKSLQPILASGGAFVVTKRFYTGSIKEFAPTHIFIDNDTDWNETELEEAKKTGAKILIPEYIWSYLLDDKINENEGDYYHDDVKKIDG